MRIDDKIDLWLNTGFKKTIDGAEIYSGHSYVKVAKWSREEGFTKLSSVSRGNLAIPCPIIAIVEKKIREKNLNLVVKGRNAEFLQTETVSQNGIEFTKDLYKPGTETTQTTFVVPRFTRKNAMFLLSGLGNEVFEIYDIQDGIVEANRVCGGEIGFYALTSEGSKVLWYLGMDMIHNLLLEISSGIWVAPTECPCCGGDGRLDDNSLCPQCGGYGYSGYNATKSIQLKKGYDVRLTREKFDSYPLTVSQNAEVRKFVNKVWTQKWWVTPTISEIKRMFAHFYNVGEDAIIIEERYHLQMPHWSISIPFEGSFGTPFDIGDEEILKFIAETVTPAGVNVFFGFYSLGELGNLDDFGCDVYTMPTLMSSIESTYALWGDRFAYHNGWCECTDNFESGVISPVWTQSGNVSIFNANDISRHVIKFNGNSEIQWVRSGASPASGIIQTWIHPQEGQMQFGLMMSGFSDFMDYIQYDQTTRKFTTKAGQFLRSGYEDCDYHLGYRFNVLPVPQKIEAEYYIDRILLATGLVDISPWWGAQAGTRIRHIGAGSGFVDNFGATDISPYVRDDNWIRLSKFGWGQNHVDSLSGVSGLYERVFRKELCFDAYGATKYP